MVGIEEPGGVRGKLSYEGLRGVGEVVVWVQAKHKKKKLYLAGNPIYISTTPPSPPPSPSLPGTFPPPRPNQEIECLFLLVSPLFPSLSSVFSHGLSPFHLSDCDPSLPLLISSITTLTRKLEGYYYYYYYYYYYLQLLLLLLLLLFFLIFLFNYLNLNFLYTFHLNNILITSPVTYLSHTKTFQFPICYPPSTILRLALIHFSVPPAHRRYYGLYDVTKKGYLPSSLSPIEWGGEEGVGGEEGEEEEGEGEGEEGEGERKEGKEGKEKEGKGVVLCPTPFAPLWLQLVEGQEGGEGGEEGEEGEGVGGLLEGLKVPVEGLFSKGDTLLHRVVEVDHWKLVRSLLKREER